MPSISYDEVYSRFYTKVAAYDLLSLREDTLNEFLCSYLHSAVSKVYVRKLFSSVSFKDDVKLFTFAMDYVIDEDSDKEFVTEVLSYGLLVEWLTPKVNNLTLINQLIAGSSEKYYSQASHLSQITAVRDSAIHEQRNMISDRGYAWNTYLDGNS